MDWLNIWLPEPIPLVCLPNILWIAQIYAGFISMLYYHVVFSSDFVCFRTSHFVFPKINDFSHMV